ncbi:MAG: hypothetical protein ACRYFX_28900 [Janthinobacterium lividum]
MRNASNHQLVSVLARLRPARRQAAMARLLPRLRQAMAAASHQTLPPNQPVLVRRKSRGIAFLLAVLFVTFPFYKPHNFYLGYRERGVIGTGLAIGGAFLLFVGSFGQTTTVAYVGGALLIGVAVWQVVDAIRILIGSLKPKDGEYYPRFFQTRPDAEVPR